MRYFPENKMNKVILFHPIHLVSNINLAHARYLLWYSMTLTLAQTLMKFLT
jgi:hypothetical protein